MDFNDYMILGGFGVERITSAAPPLENDAALAAHIAENVVMREGYAAPSLEQVRAKIAEIDAAIAAANAQAAAEGQQIE